MKQLDRAVTLLLKSQCHASKGATKKSSYVDESLLPVSCTLIGGGVQVIIASGFSLLKRVGRPNINVYLLEWNPSHLGI
jgi:hypothetical protein